MEHRTFEFDSTAAAAAALRHPSGRAAAHEAYEPPRPVPAAPAAEPPGANPWVAAVDQGRAAFAGAFGDLAKGKRNWQVAFFCLLGVTVPQTLALTTLATQARITPYVVGVDKLGRVQGFGRADRTTAADRRVAAGAVAQWVHNIRGVSTDPVAQGDMVRGAYAFVDQGVAQFLATYMTDPARDPRLLGQSLSRLVEVTSVVPLPGPGGRRAAAGPTTWKVTWTETDYPRGGGPTTSTAWEGYLTTRQGAPPSDDRLELNPLGLFITAVSWTQTSARPTAGAPAPAPNTLPTTLPPGPAPAPSSTPTIPAAPTAGGTP